MNIPLILKEYLGKELLQAKDLNEYLTRSAIVTVEIDEKLIIDLIVFIPNQIFFGDFTDKFGDCFVVNHQEQLPHIFTRFKSFQWLMKDFSNRSNIALWIFQNSIVLQDPDGTFSKIVKEQSALFEQNLTNTIKRKYIEFRSDRHNMRQVVYHKNRLSTNLLRSNVIKLALEILILAHGKPYPYKKWLTAEATKLDANRKIINICNEFANESDYDRIISLSDDLVSGISDIVLSKNRLPPNIIKEWWLHLK